MRRIRIIVTEQMPNGELVHHLAWQEVSEAAYQRELRNGLGIRVRPDGPIYQRARKDGK